MTRVLVTGGTVVLGKAVCRELEASGYDDIVALGSKDCDLRDQVATQKMVNDSGAGVVLHLAATVGGIGANKENPGRFMYENLVMGANLIEEGRDSDLKKFIMDLANFHLMKCYIKICFFNIEV